MKKLSVLVIVMLILFVASVPFSHHIQRPNNGDGWRVMRSAHILPLQGYYAHQPFPRLYDFLDIRDIDYRALIPMSSSAAIVEVVSLAQRAGQFKHFDFLWVTATYSAIYFLGILLILLNIRLILAIPVLLILVNPYVLAYFNSPYEESLFIALCPLLSFFLLQGGTSGRSATRLIALAMASTKASFAPALLFGTRNPKSGHFIVYLLMSMLVVGGVVMKLDKSREPNNYNRYFNGLSYSMSEVSSWPAHEFLSRQSIAGTRTARRGMVFPADSSRIRPYWGSSFWPTGYRLDAANRRYVSERVSPWFWETVLANPGYYCRLLTEPLFTMVTADYRMNYVFISDVNNGWLDIHAFVMQHFGLLVLLSSITILVISIRNKTPRYALVVCASLFYPLLVVYGDGYYEFERHLFPVLFLEVVLSIALLLMRYPRPADPGAAVPGAPGVRVAESAGLGA
jgi:hypothetical protein